MGVILPDADGGGYRALRRNLHGQRAQRLRPFVRDWMGLCHRVFGNYALCQAQPLDSAGLSNLFSVNF